jgi:hypothetical protein
MADGNERLIMSELGKEHTAVGGALTSCLGDVDLQKLDFKQDRDGKERMAC